MCLGIFKGARSEHHSYKGRNENGQTGCVCRVSIATEHHLVCPKDKNRDHQGF